MLIPNIILIIHMKKINTATGITQEVINNIAIASIKLLNAFSPLLIHSETLSSILVMASLAFEKIPLIPPLSSVSLSLFSSVSVQMFFASSIV